MTLIQSKDIVSLIIEPSGFCNAKCPHCPRYTDDGFLHEYIPHTHLTIDALCNGITPSLMSSLNLAHFTGATGDPAMNPQIENLIDFFNFIPNVAMDTNGSLRSTNWWQQLARFKNLTVVWAIDGLHDTNHLYRIDTDFSKIMRNAHAYNSAGGKSVWKCVVFKHNEHQLEDIRKLAQELGFAGVKFDRAYDYRFQGQLEWKVLVEGVYSHTIGPTSLSQQKLDQLGEFFTCQESGQKQFVSLSNNEILCPWLRDRKAYINTRGELLPCCMMTHETQNNYPGRDKFQEFVEGNFENISLYHHTMDEILLQYYSDKLNETLKREETMNFVCAKTCKNLFFNDRPIFKGSRVPTNKI